MKKIKITQIKSKIGHKKYQKATLKALGIRKINHSVIKEDCPQIRGMIETVNHLVKTEEISE